MPYARQLYILYIAGVLGGGWFYCVLGDRKSKQFELGKTLWL
jgi:hypothetical protein